MAKSIIGLLLGIAALAILLTACSDEPDPTPSNGTDSSTNTSSGQGVNPEPTHAPTSALTNTAAPEEATPTPAALPSATATLAAREFASVSAAFFHTCGVKADGSIQCWGDSEYGQATPPFGEFASVSAGGSTPAG